jgi:hypothetical protein
MKIGQLLQDKNHDLFKIKPDVCIADAATA